VERYASTAARNTANGGIGPSVTSLSEPFNS
jgi:hypothetical protein